MKVNIFNVYFVYLLNPFSGKPVVIEISNLDKMNKTVQFQYAIQINRYKDDIVMVQSK